MAYPLEHEHADYMKYVEAVSNSEEAGPQLSKSEWRKRRMEQIQASKAGEPKQKPPTTVLNKED
jgi:hypothetical protein